MRKKLLLFITITVAFSLLLTACKGGKKGTSSDISDANISTVTSSDKTSSETDETASGDANKEDGSSIGNSAGSTVNTNAGKTSQAGKTSNSSSSTTKKTNGIKNVPYAVREEALALRLTEEVLKRSIVSSGDMTRVANVIKKAERGEDVTIGVIGGSITDGTGASPSSEKYAEKFRAWWQSTYKNSRLSFVNAGVGSTDSLIGVHRADNDLLSKKPDLVVIEFSVNDTASQTETYQKSYEGLIRKILKQSNNPAVILLFTFDKNGTSMQKVHSQIGKHYNLPMISYKDALWPAGGTKVRLWMQISADNIHPNNVGHAILSELLINYVNTVRAQIESLSEKVAAIPAPLSNAGLENGVLMTNKTLQPTSLGSFAVNDNAFKQFKNGWTVSGGDQPLTFKVNAKNIYILYKRDKVNGQLGKAGTVTVILDGKTVGAINSDYASGWGDSAAFYQVLNAETKGEHTVEIKLTSTGEKTEFAVLGMMLS